jgi:hypothetical protein
MCAVLGTRPLRWGEPEGRGAHEIVDAPCRDTERVQLDEGKLVGKRKAEDRAIIGVIGSRYFAAAGTTPYRAVVAPGESLGSETYP